MTCKQMRAVATYWEEVTAGNDAKALVGSWYVAGSVGYGIDSEAWRNWSRITTSPRSISTSTLRRCICRPRYSNQLRFNVIKTNTLRAYYHPTLIWRLRRFALSSNLRITPSRNTFPSGALHHHKLRHQNPPPAVLPCCATLVASSSSTPQPRANMAPAQVHRTPTVRQ